MKPLDIKYGVAYKEPASSTDDILVEKYEFGFEKTDDVAQRAMKLLDAGKIAVTMFSHTDATDTTSLTWTYALDNEFLPVRREDVVAVLDRLLASFNDAKPEMKSQTCEVVTEVTEQERLYEIVRGASDMLRSSEAAGYLFMEKYYGKHPQAQGYKKIFD